MPTHQQLFSKAIRLLALRARSVKEVADRLKLTADDQDLVNQVLEDLIKKGFLNDLDFAQAFVDSRIRSKPKGKIVLKYELSQKGISQEIISTVLNQTFQDPDLELDMARNFLRKKSAFAQLDRQTFKKKAYSALKQRGFSNQTIFKIIDSNVFEE